MSSRSSRTRATAFHLALAVSEPTKNIKFDGKDYANTGPDVQLGSTSSGRLVNRRSLEITNKFQGKITDTRQVEVSIDLKTLTMRIRQAGDKEPKNILVFDRE